MIKNNILAIDVGSKRIGMSIVSDNVAVPRLMPTLPNDNDFMSVLKSIIEDKEIKKLVIGLPRNLDGDDTDQTKYVLDFVEKIKENINTKIHMQDEALSSVSAKNTLDRSEKPYEKGDIDSIAASHILLDYLNGGDY